MEILSKGEGEKEERLASERDENRRQGGQREETLCGGTNEESRKGQDGEKHEPDIEHQSRKRRSEKQKSENIGEV